MIGIIAAVSQNGIIGINNEIPWFYSEDLKHFKQMTLNSTIIMGRNTFNSIGKPLPNRENIIITSQSAPITGIKCFSSINKFFENKQNTSNNHNIWFIGGTRIYEEAMSYVDEIHLTLVPDIIDHHLAIKFPFINPKIFEVKSITPFKDNTTLYYCVYNRIVNLS